MRKMTSIEIRNMWIKFFEEKGHSYIESAPLVPEDDNSLLFVNAGVTPLKNYFDGSIVPENRRIVNIQKCIRTNDIENVGVTKRHLTFFEMMGNFSIGDYFKKEALEYAFEFLTSEDYMAIPKEKIYVTVYMSDEVAQDRWIELGLDPSHIIKLSGNFWEIGNGPCGPDSEIFYDRGESYDPEGNALEKFKNDEDQERYLEIWNNVFSQYNSEEGVDRSLYKELPNKNIDTGAGLERWCCIFQDVDSNFDTDLFVPIINKIVEISGKEYDGSKPFKLIADHIRAITMAICDGAFFENTGRGYVLRRLLRRSVRSGKYLGLNEAFMYRLVGSVVNVMGEFYPKLIENKGYIKALILEEENLFHRTLAAGERKLYELISESRDNTISGYDAFKLYDTYGFPIDLTLEYLEDNNMTTKKEEFDRYMEEAKKLAKNSRKQDNNMNVQSEELLNFHSPSDFLYDVYELESRVIALLKDGKFVDTITDEGIVILDRTCFYAESGGQIADIGAMKNDNLKAKVVDVTKAPNMQHLHKIEMVEGKISMNDVVNIKIIAERRDKIARNHSSVHIIQKMLQEYLSNTIHQAGSFVDQDRLRFDFTYTGKISEEDIIKVEEKANELIKENVDVIVKQMSLDEAKKIGAMALFSDKYKDIVRVVTIGDSIELCGGTHVKNTSEIGSVAILKIESKGSNLYRLEAATKDMIPIAISEIIAKYVDEIKKQLLKAQNILNMAKEEGITLDFSVHLDGDDLSSYKDIIYNRNQLEYIQNEVRDLEKKYKELKLKNEINNLDEYLENMVQINDIKTIIMKTEDRDLAVLKNIMDSLVVNLGKSVVFIANIDGNNVNYLCKCSKDAGISAGLLVKRASGFSLGNGGGSDTFGQGGGRDISNIDKILEDIKKDIVK